MLMWSSLLRFSTHSTSSLPFDSTSSTISKSMFNLYHEQYFNDWHGSHQSCMFSIGSLGVVVDWLPLPLLFFRFPCCFFVSCVVTKDLPCSSFLHVHTKAQVLCWVLSMFTTDVRYFVCFVFFFSPVFSLWTPTIKKKKMTWRQDWREPDISSSLFPQCQSFRFLSSTTARTFGLGPRVNTDSQ